EPPSCGPETPSRPLACHRSIWLRSSGGAAGGRGASAAQPASIPSARNVRRMSASRGMKSSIQLLQALLDLGVLWVALAGPRPHLARLIAAIQRQQHLAGVQLHFWIVDALTGALQILQRFFVS